ncbi:uncharacterized protein LOC144712408 isoform X2 [Wolffia australiana]
MAMRIASAATASSCSIQSDISVNRVKEKNWHPISYPVRPCPRSKREESLVIKAIPETAVTAIAAAMAVGAAAVFLSKSPDASQTKNISFATCEDCGGSGVCSQCKGEGFVLKKLSEESAEKARLSAANAATRYTAGNGLIAASAQLLDHV